MPNLNHAIVYRVDATSNLLPIVEPSVTLSRSQAQRFADARQRMGYDVCVQVSFAHWYLSKPEGGYWTLRPILRWPKARARSHPRLCSYQAAEHPRSGSPNHLRARRLHVQEVWG